MINLITQVFQIVGTIIFQYFFQITETRTCIYCTVYFFILSDIMNCMYAERLNLQLGISDFVFESIHVGIVNNVAGVIINLKIYLYCSKCCPNRIEGSIFTIIFMLNNFMYSVISMVWAVIISNYFVIPSMSMTNLN